MDNNHLQNIAMGERGSELVKTTDQTLHEGDYQAVQFIDETVIAVLDFELGDDWAGETVPASTILLGHFTDFQTTSGRVNLYKR